MTLKQLEAFYLAATCGNFALAAQRLHLSTSSLSKRIAELEQSLDVLLFDRTSHKASLTEAGQLLLPQVVQLLQMAEDTKRSVGQDRAVAGQCSLGVGELSALTWLPQLATHLRDSYPMIKLEPQVNIGSALHTQLLEGSLDFAVVAGRSSHPAIASHTIGEARFVWVAAPHLSPAVREMNEALLREHPLVTLPPGAGTSQILDDWLMANDIDLAQRFTCNSWGAVAGLLMEGFGIGILPEGWARSLHKRSLLRVLSSRVKLKPLSYAFQHRRHDERRIVVAMLAAVRSSVDFSTSPTLL